MIVTIWHTILFIVIISLLNFRISHMLQNYLRTAFRIILKHRLFSAFNIIGLSIGLTSCILIMSYVIHELSYDRFYGKADRIYRITTQITQEGAEKHMATTYPTLYPFLHTEFP